MNIAHLLTRQANDRPDAIAIIQPGRKITFRKLADRAARAATALRDNGVKPGDHVLVLTPMSIDLYTALIAVFQIGAVATFLDPSAGIDHINHCCEIAKPVALIGPRKVQLLRWFVRGLQHIPHSFTVSRWFPFTHRWRTACRYAKPAGITACEDADPALVTFTSGSTGRPKAAVRSHGFLRAQHEALAPAIDLVPGEVDLATLPIFTLANLASGVTTVIPNADLRKVGRVDPLPIIRQIEEHGVTRIVASPAFFERLMLGDDYLRTIEKAFTGGAPVFPALLGRMQQMMPAHVVALYGSTEAEPIAHIPWHEVTAADLTAMLREGKGLLAGKPVREIDLRVIADHSGKPIRPLSAADFDAMTQPADQPGEIVVHGDHVLKGYLGGIGDEQTKFKVDGEVWHRTGDAGYLDPAGRLWLLGRAEAKITDTHGTLYPFAVECAASAVAGVRRSALIGDRMLVIEGDADEAILREKLAWAQIKQIRRVPRIPLDKRHNAKVDYPALRKLLE